MRTWYLLCSLCALLSLTACQPRPLDEALRGQLASNEGNRVITEYCQSCHIHRVFDPLDHTQRVQALYDRTPYTDTTQCRVCHVARRDTWGSRHRRTLWPAEVADKPVPSSQKGS